MSQEIATSSIPRIFVRLKSPERLSIWARLLSAAVAIGAMWVLITAARITPNHEGYGTHEQLGLSPCGMMSVFHIPCAGCGMTTSFAWLVRGHLLASIYTQPCGFVLGLCTMAAVWIGAYLAITGSPAHRLLMMVPMKFHFWFWLPLGLGAWMWKIVLHVSGHEGW